MTALFISSLSFLFNIQLDAGLSVNWDRINVTDPLTSEVKNALAIQQLRQSMQRGGFGFRSISDTKEAAFYVSTLRFYSTCLER
mmetsp:Transcript_53485/g.141847  ORF Transcript_53485/g.141847 Transcript_53485/m.141847 type:complete len:84 (+) Transcript_53485:107-358(+)